MIKYSLLKAPKSESQRTGQVRWEFIAKETTDTSNFMEQIFANTKDFVLMIMKEENALLTSFQIGTFADEKLSEDILTKLQKVIAKFS